MKLSLVRHVLCPRQTPVLTGQYNTAPYTKHYMKLSLVRHVLCPRQTPVLTGQYNTAPYTKHYMKLSLVRHVLCPRQTPVLTGQYNTAPYTKHYMKLSLVRHVLSSVKTGLSDVLGFMNYSLADARLISFIARVIHPPIRFAFCIDSQVSSFGIHPSPVHISSKVTGKLVANPYTTENDRRARNWWKKCSRISVWRWKL